MILAVGGELDTAFVLPGIYSDDNPAPSVSEDAWHVEFPDGAVMSYEPETGALTVTGDKNRQCDRIRLGCRQRAGGAGQSLDSRHPRFTGGDLHQ